MKLLHANFRRGLICLMAVLLGVASCANEPNLRVVTFEAAIDRDGRTHPIGRTPFYLLKGNLIDLLGGDSKDPNGASRLADVTGMLPEVSNPEGRARMYQVREKHVIARAETDAQGKAKFAAVLPGTYYIFGWTRVGENLFLDVFFTHQEIYRPDASSSRSMIVSTGSFPRILQHQRESSQ